ncbi:MAG: transglutaminase family protein, partial [Thermoanaerobaculales bacterium]
DADAARPTLRFAWGSDATWQALGRWYEDLISGLSDRSGAVSALADQLTEGLTTDRERLVALADFVKRRVRYEAVEIGAGGYIPTAGGTVLDRGWGDCKDKARLLSELLAAVGIPSHPVLIRSGRSARIDIDFPSHLQFNHAILAVPAQAVGAEAGDPVVEGFLFIDATMDRGGPLWLSPYCQGHWALVVDGEQSRLVRIPVLIQLESRVLSIAGDVDDNGDFSGAAELRLRGFRALGWLRDFDSEDPARIDEAIHRVMQRLTGAKVTSATWRDLETDVPAVILTANLRIAGLVRGSAGRRRMRAPLLQGLPEARTMDARSEPLVLTPGGHRTIWKIRLPDEWCPVVPTDSNTENSTGRFTYRATMNDANTLVVDGAATVSRWWFGPESFDHLRALSIEESRTSRRSLRLRCEEATDAGSNRDVP